jgi:hypothetical protein
MPLGGKYWTVEVYSALTAALNVVLCVMLLPLFFSLIASIDI